MAFPRCTCIPTAEHAQVNFFISAGLPYLEYSPSFFFFVSNEYSPMWYSKARP